MLSDEYRETIRKALRGEIEEDEPAEFADRIKKALRAPPTPPTPAPAAPAPVRERKRDVDPLLIESIVRAAAQHIPVRGPAPYASVEDARLAEEAARVRAAAAMADYQRAQADAALAQKDTERAKANAEVRVQEARVRAENASAAAREVAVAAAEASRRAEDVINSRRMEQARLDHESSVRNYERSALYLQRARDITDAESEWVVNCDCGWQSDPYPDAESAKSAGDKHDESCTVALWEVAEG